MDKVLLLSFIEDTYRTFKGYKSLYLFKYFKTIKEVFNKINIDNKYDNKIHMNNEIYSYEYDFDIYGTYRIDIDVSSLLILIDKGKIKPKKFKSNEIKFDFIYHESPCFFIESVNYNSKVIITEFISINYNYAIIDGNHTYEKYINQGEIFDTYYIPYYEIPRKCYCNDFSYVFHYIINELNFVFAIKNKKQQKLKVKNSRIYLIDKEIDHLF